MCLCYPPNTLPASWRSTVLVERPPAVLGSAQTRDLHVLDGELVVIGNLLVDADWLARVDYDLLLRLHRNHLGVAVGLRDTYTKRHVSRFQLIYLLQKAKEL